jgi:hypothetical protein
VARRIGDLALRVVRLDFGADGNPESVAIGDINGDGRPDIVVTAGNHIVVLPATCL